MRLVADGCGTLHHLYLRNLDVHDVSGDLRKSHEGCGIYFESQGGKASRFDDLRIENCHVARTDRNGICQRRCGQFGPQPATWSSAAIVLEDIGGDGIKPWGSDGALVEHNVLRGGRMRCQDAAAGIWPWDCDDTVIQFNEVCGMKGTGDGQGFDSDFLCRRSIFQYNYSHDNEGGFMLICTPGRFLLRRYHHPLQHQPERRHQLRTRLPFRRGARNTFIYNNVIYIGPKQDLPLLRYTEWSGGNARNTHFLNNIFYVDGRVTYEWGKSTENVFEHNVFFGNHQGRPDDRFAITEKPPLVSPGSGRSGFDSLAGYRLKPGVPFPRGTTVLDNGERDFFGNPVPEHEPAMPGVLKPKEH